MNHKDLTIKIKERNLMEIFGHFLILISKVMVLQIKTKGKEIKVFINYSEHCFIIDVE